MNQSPAALPDPLLKVQNLTFHYAKTQILHEISFEVPKDSVFAILGPNGSGKTTLLRCLNQLLRPKSGEVWLENQNILKLTPQVRARKIAYAPQRTAVSGLSVFDSVLLGRLPHRTWNSARTDTEKTWKVLERLNLAEKAHRPLDSLSGGELQKAAMARVLAQEPQLILLDEPTSALDWKNRVEILSLLAEIAKKDGLGIVLTLHDINDALSYADQLLLLRKGKIAAQTVPDALTGELLTEIYGLPIEIHELNGRRLALSPASMS